MLGTRSITERLAHLLLHLIDIYGVKEPQGILIGAAFTHADLAHMVGATRQWVTISLKRLQEQGMVICQKSQDRCVAARRCSGRCAARANSILLPTKAAIAGGPCRKYCAPNAF